MKTAQCDTFECYNQTNLHCKKCKKSFYCCGEHQKAEWYRHREICREDRSDTIDGYELCEMILKANDSIDSSLTGLAYRGVEIDVEKNIVTVMADPREDDDRYHMIDSPATFHDQASPEEENTTKSRKAYWCLRSLSSAFVLTSIFSSLLQHLRDVKEYKYIRFVTPDKKSIILSLESIEMRGWLVLPTIRVLTNRGDKSVERDMTPKEIPHITLCVDDYVIDIAAGRFWLFDSLVRPICIVPTKNYVSLIGEEGKEVIDITDMIETLISNKVIRCHAATLLYTLYQRLDLDWEKNGSTMLRGIERLNQEEKIRNWKGMSDENLNTVLGSYLNECQSPAIQALRGVYEAITTIQSDQEQPQLIHIDDDESV